MQGGNKQFSWHPAHPARPSHLQDKFLVYMLLGHAGLELLALQETDEELIDQLQSEGREREQEEEEGQREKNRKRKKEGETEEEVNMSSAAQLSQTTSELG